MIERRFDSCPEWVSINDTDGVPITTTAKIYAHAIAEADALAAETLHSVVPLGKIVNCS